MTWTSVITRFRGWIAAIKQVPETTKSDPDTTNSPEWYVGLAVSPAAFSRQLGDMQASLLNASKPHTKAAQSRDAEEQVAMTTRRGA